MHALIAFDKFKDALSAAEANRVAHEAWAECHPDWTVETCVLADGGDGFASAVTGALGGREVAVKVSDPLGRPLSANLGWVESQSIPASFRGWLESLGIGAGRPLAVLEMAAASGLALLPLRERNPWRTSTRGTGELLRAAAQMGAGGVVLGVGGSATHDLGLGALGVLGYEFLDTRGRRIDPPVPARWAELAEIRREWRMDLPPLVIATDVINPLVGPAGAAACYAQQKGLPASDVLRLDDLTEQTALLLCDHADRSKDDVMRPGMGAAGGLAFGLEVGLGARCTAGFDVVARALDLEARLQRADLVISGEGRLDATSWRGKGPVALASRARALGKRAVLFVGSADEKCLGAGIAVVAVTPPGLPVEEAIPLTAQNLRQALRVWDPRSSA